MDREISFSETFGELVVANHKVADAVAVNDVEGDVLDMEGLSSPEVPAEEGGDAEAGKLELLEVPEESSEEYDPDAEDVNTADTAKVEIRKPDLLEVFTICPSAVMYASLVAIKTGKGGWTTRYYSVDPAVRPLIGRYVKKYAVVPWYSFRDGAWSLWILSSSSESTTWTNFQPMLHHRPEYYANNAFIVSWADSSYDFRKLAPPRKAPAAPSRKVSVMLGESLGLKGFIRNAEHHIVQQLHAGDEA